jgi:hypothetical protein
MMARLHCWVGGGSSETRVSVPVSRLFVLSSQLTQVSHAVAGLFVCESALAAQSTPVVALCVGLPFAVPTPAIAMHADLTQKHNAL